MGASENAELFSAEGLVKWSIISKAIPITGI